MRYVEGTIFTDEGIIEGHIGFEEGMIQEVGRGPHAKAELRGIVIPTLINAHTHIADFIVPVDLNLPLEAIVAPPDGMKHRALREASPQVLMKNMEYLALFMLRKGISQFIDFREGGINGASLLKNSCKNGAKPFIMGRPADTTYNRDEAEALLKTVDGIGVSSISDWDYGELKALAEFTRSRGKMFALHASENKREDIDQILDLKPDLLVHMTMASEDDLEICADEGVPVVVCPRSNLFFGIIPPLQKMLEKGLMIALGTDNAMTTMPDILLEMEFTARLMRYQGMKNLDAVLEMAIANGRKILNLNGTIGIRPGSPCDFMVLRSRGGNPVSDLILRSASEDPLLVCVGERIWRKPE